MQYESSLSLYFFISAISVKIRYSPASERTPEYNVPLLMPEEKDITPMSLILSSSLSYAKGIKSIPIYL